MADFTKRTLTSSSGSTISSLKAEVDSLGQNKLGDAYVDLGVNLAPLESGLALGLLALEGYFVHAYAKMETQMRNIWTIMSISEEQLAGIQDEILKMSREVPQTATQLAEGYYDIVSSGIEAKDAMKVLNVAAKAASAGLTSTETATRGLVYVLNAYSLSADEAQRVSDIMFKAVDKGVFTYEQLANSIGHYTNMAAALKIPIEEVVAAQAAMSLTGLNAAEAGTALNQVLTAFAKPSENMQFFIEEQGYKTAEAMVQTLGLVEAMERFALTAEVADQAGYGYTETTMKYFKNVRAGRGAMALMRNDTEAYAKIVDILYNSAGATQKAFDKQVTSTTNSITELKNSANELAIRFGETAAPAFNAAADGLSAIIQYISDLDPNTLKVINATAGIAAITSAFKTVEAVLPKVLALMGTGEGGLLSLFTAANPVGLIFLGGAAVAAIVQIISKLEDWEGRAKATAKENEEMLSGMMRLVESTGQQAEDLAELITVYKEYKSESVLTAEQQKKFNDVVAQIESIAPGVVNAWDDMGNAIGINVEAASYKVRDLLAAQLEYAKGAREIAELQIENSKDTRARLAAEKTAVSAQLNAIDQYENLLNKINYDQGKAWQTRRGWVLEGINKGTIKTYEDAAKVMGDGWGNVTEQLMAVKTLIDENIGLFGTLRGKSINEILLAVTSWSTRTEELAEDEKKLRARLIEVNEEISVFTNYEVKAKAAATEVDALTESIKKLDDAMKSLQQRELNLTPGTNPGPKADAGTFARYLDEVFKPQKAAQVASLYGAAGVEFTMPESFEEWKIKAADADKAAAHLVITTEKLGDAFEGVAVAAGSTQIGDLFRGFADLARGLVSKGYSGGVAGKVDDLLSGFLGSYFDRAMQYFDSGAMTFEDAFYFASMELGMDIQKNGMKLVGAIGELAENLQEYDSKLLQRLGEGLAKTNKTLADFTKSLGDMGGELGGLLSLAALQWKMFFFWWDKIFDLFNIGPYSKNMSEGWRKFWSFLGFNVGSDDSSASRPAFQISEISGPMRDSIVTALDPLKVMYSYPTYKDEIVAAILSVRDAITGTAQLGAAAALGGLQQTFNIQTINITAANGETFKSIMADLETQARLAAVGAGG